MPRAKNLLKAISFVVFFLLFFLISSKYIFFGPELNICRAEVDISDANPASGEDANSAVFDENVPHTLTEWADHFGMDLSGKIGEFSNGETITFTLGDFNALIEVIQANSFDLSNVSGITDASNGVRQLLIDMHDAGLQQTDLAPFGTAIPVLPVAKAETSVKPSDVNKPTSDSSTLPQAVLNSQIVVPDSSIKLIQTDSQTNIGDSGPTEADANPATLSVDNSKNQDNTNGAIFAAAEDINPKTISADNNVTNLDTGQGVIASNSMMPGESSQTNAAPTGSGTATTVPKDMMALGTITSLPATLEQVGGDGKPIAQSTDSAAVKTATVTDDNAASNGAASAGANLQPLALGNNGQIEVLALGMQTKPNVILLGKMAVLPTAPIGNSIPSGTQQTSSPPVSYSNPVPRQATTQPTAASQAISPAPATNASPSLPDTSSDNLQSAPTGADNTTANTSPDAINNTYAVKETVEFDSPDQSPVDAAATVNLIKGGSSYTATLKAGQASRVDFYIQGQSLAVLLYLGAGVLNSSSGLWEFVFDSSAFPNGGYELFALVARPGGSFQSPRFSFTIDNAFLANVGQQSVLKDQLILAQQVINDSGQAAQTGLANKTMSVILPPDVTNSPAFQADIADFTSAVSQLKQLDNSLTLVEAQNSKIAGRIVELKQALAGLTPLTMDSLRNDMVAELNELMRRKLALDASIVDIQKQIKAQQDKQNRAKSAILELVGQPRKDIVLGQLSVLEQSVGHSAQQAVDAQNELSKDSDLDGLSDYQELFTYKTNPYNPDTDGDGFLDGDEVDNGFNPLDPRDHKKIAYQDPRAVPPRDADVYTVDSATVIVAGGQTNIKLAGRGLANSYVDIFIYSQPLVVVVKTDSQGRWEYVLGKPLVDGLHTVYAARINSLGEIEARSREYVFLKAGANVTPRIEDTAAPQSIVGQLQSNFGFYAFCLTLIGIGVAILIIGLAARTVKKDTPEKPQVAGPTLK